MNLSKEMCAAIFDEWMRQYKANPESFDYGDTDSYGQSCADTFFTIAEELQGVES